MASALVLTRLGRPLAFAPPAEDEVAPLDITKLSMLLGFLEQLQTSSRGADHGSASRDGIEANPSSSFQLPSPTVSAMQLGGMRVAVTSDVDAGVAAAVTVADSGLESGDACGSGAGAVEEVESWPSQCLRVRRVLGSFLQRHDPSTVAAAVRNDAADREHQMNNYTASNAIGAAATGGIGRGIGGGFGVSAAAAAAAAATGGGRVGGGASAAADWGDDDLDDLALPFAPFEAQALRALVLSPPHEELWLRPIVASSSTVLCCYLLEGDSPALSLARTPADEASGAAPNSDDNNDNNNIDQDGAWSTACRGHLASRPTLWNAVLKAAKASSPPPPSPSPSSCSPSSSSLSSAAAATTAAAAAGPAVKRAAWTCISRGRRLAAEEGQDLRGQDNASVDAHASTALSAYCCSVPTQSSKSSSSLGQADWTIVALSGASDEGSAARVAAACHDAAIAVSAALLDDGMSESKSPSAACVRIPAAAAAACTSRTDARSHGGEGTGGTSSEEDRALVPTGCASLEDASVVSALQAPAAPRMPKTPTGERPAASFSRQRRYRPSASGGGPRAAEPQDADDGGEGEQAGPGAKN